MNEQKVKKAKKWVIIALKEVANILTNVLVPFVSVLVIIAELIPVVPTIWVQLLKSLEYMLFNAAGTAEDIAEKAEEELNKKAAKK